MTFRDHVCIIANPQKVAIGKPGVMAEDIDSSMGANPYAWEKSVTVISQRSHAK